MAKKLLSLLFAFQLVLASAQETRYIIYFDDKKTDLDISNDFDQKALSRRARNNVPFPQFSDYPVNHNYLETVEQLAGPIVMSSRWLNACVVSTDQKTLETIHTLPFVINSELLPEPLVKSAVASYDTILEQESRSILMEQTRSMGGQLFHKNKLNGRGIRVAVFDVGFKGVDTAPPFDHLRSSIIATWDFVKQDTFVYDYGTHGTMVLSCIGGKTGEESIGLATGAEFLLARTERLHSERLSEEEFWLAAAEWADRQGADIINSSLGYTHHRYFYKDMDGRTSLVARAATIAAQKGILVVNAAGNEGSGKWRYIGTPADADSVLSVGGIDPDSRARIAFTSYGPTSDGRVKPNVSAFGEVMAAGPNGMVRTQGTSFSSPLVAGFAACVLQTDTTLSVMDLFRKIEQSGHLYPYFDYAHGYGIPQASKILGQTKYEPVQFSIGKTGTIYSIKLSPKESSSEDASFNQLYYHVADSSGRLLHYKVILVEGQSDLEIEVGPLPAGGMLKAWYRGHVTALQNEL